MSDINLIPHYAGRMHAAINQAVDAMERKSGAENDKAAILAMLTDLLRNGSRIVEECTGKSEMLNGSIDTVRDDLSDAFDQLIADEEPVEGEDDGRYFSRRVLATVSYDAARGR